MRWTAVCAAIGAVATLLLIGKVGFGSVLNATIAVGAGGIAVMVLARLLSLTACATAWSIIGQRHQTARVLFLWFRCLRDAANDILGVIPCAGEMAASRAMVLAGQPPIAATASLVADLTIELLAQIVFTLIGAALLLDLLPRATAAFWAIGSATGLMILVVAFAGAQRLGVAEILRWLGARIIPANLASAAAGLDRELAALYSDRLQVMTAHATHVIAWVLGAVETWIGCHLLGVPIGFEAAYALECIVFAMRSAAFFVPSGLGVQESGYLVIGAFLGVPAETALALSLVKRARDVMLDVPALLAWQVLEALQGGLMGPRRSAKRARDDKPQP